MDCPALWAGPPPHIEVLRSRPLSAAGRTKLAGGVEAVYRHHLFPIPLGLIDQLSAELTRDKDIQAAPHDASAIDFASLWFLTMFFGAKFSMQMTSF